MGEKAIARLAKDVSADSGATVIHAFGTALPTMRPTMRRYTLGPSRSLGNQLWAISLSAAAPRRTLVP